jgi:hypothetical protein
MSLSNDPSQFLLAEFQGLRSEILKRTEIQHQLISITLVALGALISVGLELSATALLAYPMLAVFLAAAWSSNDIQIAQLGAYIRDDIEKRLLDDGLGWEHHISSEGISKLIGYRALLATRGLFLGSEVLAVVLYLVKKLGAGDSIADLRGVFSIADAVFLMLALIAIGSSFAVLRRQRAAENLRKGGSE